MLSGEPYIIDASWLFFACWTVVLVVLNVIAFGRDLVHDRESASASASSLPKKSRL